MARMKKSEHLSEKTALSIPAEFDLKKYDFEDNFVLWKIALSYRVALRKELDDLVTSRLLVDVSLEEGSEKKVLDPRFVLSLHATRSAQSKVLALIDKPAPGNDEYSPLDMFGGTGLLAHGHYSRRCDAIGDRLVRDEMKSAAKLNDQLYKKIFDRAMGEHAKSSSKMAGMFGLTSPSEFRKTLAMGDNSAFAESYKIWQADMQTPDFSGEFGIKVNLHYDDDSLCKAFAEWLKVTRDLADFPVAKHRVVTDKQMKEWRKMGILPCIDLWFYKRAFNAKFSQKDIGERLYSRDVYTDSGWDYEKRVATALRTANRLTRQSVFLSLREEKAPIVRARR